MPTDDQDTAPSPSDNSDPSADQDFIVDALRKLSPEELVSRIGRLTADQRAELLAEPTAREAYAEVLESVRDALAARVDNLERESPWLAVAMSKPWPECEREILSAMYEGELSTGAFVAIMTNRSAIRAAETSQPGDVLAGVLDLLGVKSSSDLNDGSTRAAFELILESLRTLRPGATAAEQAALGQALAGLRRRALKGGLPDNDGVLEPAEETNRRMWAIIDRYSGRSIDLETARAIQEALRIEVSPRYGNVTAEQVHQALGDQETSTRIRAGHLRVAVGLYRPKSGETPAEAAFNAGRAVEKSLKPKRE